MQTVSGVSVALARAVERGDYLPGDALPSVRALAAVRGCGAGTVARAYQRLRVAGVATGRQRTALRVTPDGVARARALLRGGPPLRLAGSDDPALDLLLESLGDRVTLVPGPRGSVTGIGLLARGAADAAAVHLQHVATGRHNDDFVRSLAWAGPVTLLHLWRREQVLVLPPGNPHGIASVADLAGRVLAWRHAGTGSRMLLERLLRESGATASPDAGVVADSHLGVAVAVASGAADAGLAVRAAAEAVGAEWVPVVEEPFELAVRSDRVEAVAELTEALGSRRVRRALDALPGYDLTDAGTLRNVA